jgi:hypothetical protein
MEVGRFSVDAEDCRAKARDLRETARTAKDTTARAHLLVLAEQYDWLAKHAEDDGRNSKKRSGKKNPRR